MSETPRIGGAEFVLVRYGELSLKGNNRKDFERQLARNVYKAVQPIAPATVERDHQRILVRPERRVEAVARRLQDVFGASSVSPAWRTECEMPAVLELARAVAAEALAEHPGNGEVRWRVRTARADKRFPLTSVEVDRAVGAAIGAAFPRLRVDLSHPELVLGIELRDTGAFLFARRLPGAGGLPVGTLGRALSLISGGIDSPVASYLALKRGLTLAYVTFHSHPFIGEPSKKKVVDLVRILARFQPRTSRLFVVPFAEIQLEIRKVGFASYRTVLYRRMMQRIASSLAAEEDAGALVTGECLGQVASQTLENLTCIQDAAALPVLRPLLTNDKEETIAVARRIGTFDVSAVQEPDCCTLFMPDRPVIRGKLEDCLAAEARFDAEGLARAARERTERIDVEEESGLAAR